jgi:hypothetical protein
LSSLQTALFARKSWTSGAFARQQSQKRLFEPKKVVESARPSPEFMRAQLAIIYVVQKGKEAGVMLVPHRYRDGTYLASKCKQGPHLRVESTEELLTHMVSGYSIHMSNPETRHHRAPRLIRPQSIRVEWVS